MTTQEAKRPTAPDSNPVIDGIRQLRPLVESNLEAMDAERSMPQSIANALAEMGAFKMWAPPEMGGLGLSAADGYRLIIEASILDGSVGWNTMILGLYSVMAGHLPAEHAKEIFGPPNAAVAGQLQPGSAVAMPVDGGYEVSGRWPFGSGSAHANWFVGQCVIPDPAKPPVEGELPNIRLLFMPRDQIQIIDTWNTIGLRGTGSNDYAVNKAFVPSDRSLHILFPQPSRSEPIYQFPLLILFPATLPAVMVGIARAAVDLAAGIARTKRAGIPPSPLIADARVHSELGRADALVESVRAYAISILDEATAGFERGEQLPRQLAARLQTSAGLTSAACREAMQISFALAGSGAIPAARRMARQLRELQTASAHAATSFRQFTASGRALLGLEGELPGA